MNDREKIDADDLCERADFIRKERSGIWNGISKVVAGPRGFFEGSGKNGLREIFEFIAQVYLNLTSHNSSTSYYGKAAGDRTEYDSPYLVNGAVLPLRGRVDARLFERFGP